MSWYRVSGRESAGTPAIRILAAALVALSAAVVSFRSFPTVAVTVDGQRVQLASGSSAADAIRAAEGTVPAGDLLGAVDHEVVRPGGGQAPRVTVNGERVSLDEAVYSGDVLATRRGSDAVESIVTSRVAIPIPVQVRGSGPLVRLERPGAPGLRELRVGAVSGQVVESRTVELPVAMVYRRAVPTKHGRLVALTFDDGPWPGQTEKILKVLRDEDVKATFFMVGLRVRRAPWLARQVVADGHLLGNHTEHHRELQDLGFWSVTGEIKSAEKTIKDATGVAPHWFRPPGGGTSAEVYRASAKLKMKLALWNVDPQDWGRPGTGAIVNRVVSAVEPGSVVIMHDGGGNRKQTIRALKRIIDELRDRGYTFVTLDEMPGTGWR